MSHANDFIVQKQFELDSREQNYNVLVEERQKVLEEEASRELDARMRQSLADYITWPSWNVENAEGSHICRYTLTMKIIFKP